MDIAEAAVSKIVERNHLGNLLEFLKQEAKNATGVAKKRGRPPKGSK